MLREIPQIIDHRTVLIESVRHTDKSHIRKLHVNSKILVVSVLVESARLPTKWILSVTVWTV